MSFILSLRRKILNTQRYQTIIIHPVAQTLNDQLFLFIIKAMGRHDII